MKKAGKVLFIILIAIILVPMAVFAGRPRIISAVMVPPNPDFGQYATVTISYCSNQQPAEIAIAVSSYSTRVSAGTGGQVFVVSKSGIDVPTVIFPTDPISIEYAGNTTYDACGDCGGDLNSKVSTRQYVFRIPDRDMFPGCATSKLYLHVGMKDDGGGIYKSEWQGLAACETGTSVGLPLTWNIPVPPAGFTMRKRAEGFIQNTNDLVLFSIDYEYANGPLTITDTLPGGGNLTLVSVGPNPIPNGGSCTFPTLGSATSGTITWVLPNRTGAYGSTTGTVWFLMRANTNIAAGTPINNTATGTMNSTVKTSTANLIAGQAAITVEKIASASQVNKNGTITYYLNYQVNGSQLKAYRPFDDFTSGTIYSNPATPPPGWKYNPFSSNYGSWQIRDDCGTGDKYLYGMSNSTYGQAQYPAMLLDDTANTLNVQFCTGIIMSDVMIDPVGFDGADALVIIRANGLSGASSYAYGLLLSIDTAPASGYIAIQKCGGGSCSWNGGSTAYQIVGNKWYRVKVEVTLSGNNYVFNAKVWGRGDPEPTNYQISWTDTGAATNENWRCDGLGTYNDWRPGVSEQKGDYGDTRDAYDNFVVYVPRTSADTTLYDTIPDGFTFAGCTGSCTSSPRVLWNLGNVSNASGSYTWWGQADTCNNVTNTAAIDGLDPIVPQFSNEVVTEVFCLEATTITKTASPILVSIGETVTFTLAYCNHGQKALANYSVWDNIPAYMTYISSLPNVTPSAGKLTWNIGSLAVGACGSVKWWGKVTSIPMNPLRNIEQYFVYNGFDDTLYGRLASVK
ncbi:MAG: DUF11 domain-containing protein [Spirochaetia bacterium]|nr:DUF11 domain-containing protein [Spirochaetia bacterium]